MFPQGLMLLIGNLVANMVVMQLFIYRPPHRNLIFKVVLNIDTTINTAPVLLPNVGIAWVRIFYSREVKLNIRVQLIDLIERSLTIVGIFVNVLCSRLKIPIFLYGFLVTVQTDRWWLSEAKWCWLQVNIPLVFCINLLLFRRYVSVFFNHATVGYTFQVSSF